MKQGLLSSRDHPKAGRGPLGCHQPASRSRPQLPAGGDAPASAPVFQSGRRPGSPLTERAVNFIVKEAAERAGVDPAAAILCYATPPPNTDYFIKADAVLPPVIELSGEGGGLRCAVWRAFSRVPPISR